MPAIRLAVTLAFVTALAACRDAERADPNTAAPPALQDAETADARTGGRRGERAAALPADVKDVTGRVTRASEDEVVIRPEGGERPITLRVGDDATVTVDGRTASAEDIREGAEIEAAYAPTEGGARAVRIRVENGPKGK